MEYASMFLLCQTHGISLYVFITSNTWNKLLCFNYAKPKDMSGESLVEGLKTKRKCQKLKAKAKTKRIG